MTNRFADVNSMEELVFQLAGAASMCWENIEGAGVFDSARAKQVSEEAFERLVELLVDNHQTTEVEISVEFTTYVRKPFTVEAVEVTVENIHELSDLIGTFGEDENGPYIQVDRSKVPTVFRVTPGYWVTKMGSNIRCYSPRVFEEQFVESDEVVERYVNRINRGRLEAVSE